MTSEEYRQVLGKLSHQQLRELNEHIFKGNQATVEQMIHVFDKYGDVEPKVVFWLTQNLPEFKYKTQADRVAEANIMSAEVGQQSLTLSQSSLKISQRSLTIAYCSLAVAILAAVVSIIALCK